jgi:hypothetical protein
LLLAPGIDLRINKINIYADVSFPIYQRVNIDDPSSGNIGQLTASTIWRFQIGYNF